MQTGFLQIGDNANVSLKCLLAGSKEGINMTGKGQSYKYVSQQDLRELDDLIAEHECVLIVSVLESRMEARVDAIQGAKDPAPKPRMMTHSECMVQARLQFVGDPKDYVSVTCSAFKLDYSDKASGSQTTARRYAKMHLFNIPTDGKDEADSQAPVNSGGLFDVPAQQAPATNLFAFPAAPSAPQQEAAPPNPLGGLFSS